MSDERKLLTLTFDEQDAAIAEALMGIGLTLILEGKPSRSLGVLLGGGQAPELVMPVLIAFTEDVFDAIGCLTAQATGFPCPIHDMTTDKRTELPKELIAESLSNLKARSSRLGDALREFNQDFRTAQVKQFLIEHPLVDRRKTE